MTALRVLIVEDHPDLAGNIGDYLSARGDIVDFAMDGISGMHLALTGEFDVIVLDLMLPGMDGLTLCQKLRQEAHRQTPVLMLTARDTLDDKLTGFEKGADDYLVKPFALEELAARINALAKRGRLAQAEAYQVLDLTFHPGTKEVTRCGKKIELNRACLKILEILIKAHPNIVTRQELERALWGDMPPGSDSLRSHMYTLRHKLDKPFAYPILKTLHGIGYGLVSNEEANVQK